MIEQVWNLKDGYPSLCFLILSIVTLAYMPSPAHARSVHLSWPTRDKMPDSEGMVSLTYRALPLVPVAVWESLIVWRLYVH